MNNFMDNGKIHFIPKKGAQTEGTIVNNKEIQYNIDNDLWYQPHLANNNGLTTLTNDL